MRFAIYLMFFLARLTYADSSQLLRENLNVEGIREHQKALQDIANRHNNNRMAGTEGYRQSVSYVAGRLRATGYEVRLQDFHVSIATDQSPPELSKISPHEQIFALETDFVAISYAGRQEVVGLVEAVDLKIPSAKPNDSSSGCEAEDFKNFTRGAIALLQRGSCNFNTKVELAKAAGASAVIIFNEGNEGRTEVFSSRLGESSANFAVLAASFAVGQALSNMLLNGPTGNSVRVKIDINNSDKPVQNIIAETSLGDPNSVIVVGAHLDSVHGGAGINDNASGSATILKIAELYAALKIQPRNKIRFIWFGAEEFGLVGSEFYVDSLSLAERNSISAMLNFDMLGSPNYARFVYDGDNSGKTELSALAGPHGSAALEKIFLDYFASQNFITHPTAFNGRSDYGPFIAVGIPAGGLFSGAEGRKSARMAEIYGGEANKPYDPCYHRSCDNFAGTEGLALKSLHELSQAAAHAVGYLGSTEQQIRGPETFPVVIPTQDWEYKGPLLVK
jgi:Zn-dependent M28 family amino/carboxypeptidase